MAPPQTLVAAPGTRGGPRFAQEDRLAYVFNTQLGGHMGKKMQTELMDEMHSKSLVRASGRVFFMKLSKNTNYNPKR